MTYGQVFSAFTGSVVGLQNSDAVTVAYDSTGAPASANAGQYDITVGTVTFTTGLEANYTITKTSAVNGLTVNKADATVVVTESLEIGERQLALAPKLKVVQKYGAMLRGIDVAACKASHTGRFLAPLL